MAMLRAYLIEATYDWITEHSFTPYLLVDTEYDKVILPKKCIDEDRKILLNVSPEAINNFYCNDQFITFDATFNGILETIQVPVEAVLELYANETSQGLYAREFGYGMDVNEGDDTNSNPPLKKKDNDDKGKLHLI